MKANSCLGNLETVLLKTYVVIYYIPLAPPLLKSIESSKLSEKLNLLLILNHYLVFLNYLDGWWKKIN